MLTFSIRGREYTAERLLDEPTVMRVTGQVRGKGGALLPQIVPKLAKALLAENFPASPWAHNWEEHENGIDFAECPTVAWSLLKGDFGPIVKADPVCLACHADAGALRRRAALAGACGLVYTDHEFFLEIKEINERYTGRLTILWLEFEHPAKAAMGTQATSLFSFPAGAYRRDKDALADPEPGDLEWIRKVFDLSVARIHGVFPDFPVVILKAQPGREE